MRMPTCERPSVGGSSRTDRPSGRHPVQRRPHDPGIAGLPSSAAGHTSSARSDSTEIAIGVVVGCIASPSPDGASATSLSSMVQGAGAETASHERTRNARAAEAGLAMVTSTGLPRSTLSPAAGREATTRRRLSIWAGVRPSSPPVVTRGGASPSPAAQIAASAASGRRPASSGTVTICAAVVPPPSPPPHAATPSATGVSAMAIEIAVAKRFLGDAPLDMSADVNWRTPRRTGRQECSARRSMA